jgi:hypothetical protein
LNFFRSSSIIQKLRSSFIIKKIEVIFHLKKMEVVFHILSRWSKIMLHTQTQLPMLPKTARNVIIPTKIVLNCFGLLVGLWQLCILLTIFNFNLFSVCCHQIQFVFFGH